MSVDIHKNWQEICQIEDTWLRMLMVTCEDAQILSSIQIGFPQFFSAEPSELFVPLTGLLQMVSETEGGMWGDVLSELKIPSFEWGSSINAVSEHIPTEWLNIVKDALKDTKHGIYVFDSADKGYFPIQWKGEECVLVDAICYGGGEPEGIEIVPKRFIDFSS